MVRVTPPWTAADGARSRQVNARMTLFDLRFIVPLFGVLGMAILWEVRSRVAARVAARRLATAGTGVLAVLLVVSVSVQLVAPGLQIPPSRLLNWKLNSGPSGSRNAAAVQTTTMVGIEVEHPGCTPTSGGSWLADPIITYTPWSVTITMHMNDTPEVANCGSQQTPHEGSLPLVGGYLMGVLVTVHLTEPLGGRALFDGSSFPPAERSLR
jgi:hypothetical protein